MSHKTDAKSGEFVTFRVGAQEFGIDIMQVREIRGWVPPTPLPHSPDYVRGVINLRGVVLPIVDLTSRLGFPSTDVTARHVIIVAQIGQQHVGLLVDAVSGIITVEFDQIQSTPEVVSQRACSFLRGVLPLNGMMVSLLGLENLMPSVQGEAA